MFNKYLMPDCFVQTLNLMPACLGQTILSMMFAFNASQLCSKKMSLHLIPVCLVQTALSKMSAFIACLICSKQTQQDSAFIACLICSHQMNLHSVLSKLHSVRCLHLKASKMSTPACLIHTALTMMFSFNASLLSSNCAQEDVWIY